jgi:hypothetical protein
MGVGEALVPAGLFRSLLTRYPADFRPRFSVTVILDGRSAAIAPEVDNENGYSRFYLRSGDRRLPLGRNGLVLGAANPSDGVVLPGYVGDKASPFGIPDFPVRRWQQIDAVIEWYSASGEKKDCRVKYKPRMDQGNLWIIDIEDSGCL